MTTDRSQTSTSGDDHADLLAEQQGPVVLGEPSAETKDPGHSESGRAGLVTIVGLPNVGKSTLMNGLLGEKLAIMSPKPQTTRDQIRGIYTAEDTQIVFVDTPGIHESRAPLNRAMVGQAIEALEQVDLVIVVIDVQKVRDAWKKLGFDPSKGGLAPTSGEEAEARLSRRDRKLLRRIRHYTDQFLFVLNKIDRVRKTQLLPIMETYAAVDGNIGVLPVSAITGDGFSQLVDAIRPHLPVCPRLYDGDMLTDRSLRFLCAELLREQVFHRTRQEVPYGVAVQIEVFTEHSDVTHIQSVVWVERATQRGILLGKGGQMMKELASAARAQMEQMLQRRVFLEVHVRVEPKWSERVETLRRLGYSN
ncbi:MAG TPA: GTPase Era [Myxococcales bacterium]|nr:GTPase Era [Myxococcales bacterium]HAN31497.1 GTPase Era [Myxococcales bacterium]